MSGTVDMLFVSLLAFLILGPGKLPEIAKRAGRVLNDVRRAKDELTMQIADEWTTTVSSKADCETQMERPIAVPSEGDPNV